MQGTMTNNSTEESKDNSRSTNISHFIELSNTKMEPLEKDILYAVLDLKKNLIGDCEAGEANIHAELNKKAIEITKHVLKVTKNI